MKGLNSYKIGKYKVYVLTEKLEGSTDILINASDAILEKYAPNKKFAIPVRVYIVNDGESWSLFDAGLNSNIFDDLYLLGISPLDIRKIYLTHIHRDHIGGLLRDDKPLFPNATIILSQKEYDFWTNDAELDKIPEVRKRHGLLVQNFIHAYKSHLIVEDPTQFDDVKEDGIYMLEAYGHTPGHVMYLLKSEGDNLLFWGDIIHHLSVQISHPEISVQFDIDPILAKESRLRIMDYVSTNHIPIAGAHIPFEGIGYIRKENSHYSFELCK